MTRDTGASHCVGLACPVCRSSVVSVGPPPREQQLDLRVREERILCRREALVLAETQRRDPMRIVRVALVRGIDEPAGGAAARPRPGRDGHGGAYVTPASHPGPWPSPAQL